MTPLPSCNAAEPCCPLQPANLRVWHSACCLNNRSLRLGLKAHSGMDNTNIGRITIAINEAYTISAIPCATGDLPAPE